MMNPHHRFDVDRGFRGANKSNSKDAEQSELPAATANSQTPAAPACEGMPNLSEEPAEDPDNSGRQPNDHCTTCTENAVNKWTTNMDTSSKNPSDDLQQAP